MRAPLQWMVLLFAFLFGGCDWTDTAAVDEQVVVEAYLIAGEPLPSVRLTTSASVDGNYSPEARAVLGADVVITQLGPDGEAISSHPYRSSQSEPSLYVPVESARVVPLARYALRIALSSGGAVTAETTVPDTLSVLSASGDTTIFREEQIQLTLTRSHYPGRQAYIIFTAESLAPTAENATDLTQRLLEDDDDQTLEDFRRGSSPPLNESTYLQDDESRFVIDVPWLGIWFYGPYVVRISAIDDNLYDFLRSQLVQQGGSTFLPGEVPNILDHVEGGTGVFGSYAEASWKVYVRRPPD